jgi:membrane glycosyltransferase
VAAFAITMADPVLRKAFGGWRRTLAGVVIETLVSALVTPVVMVSQTVAVAALLLGRDFGWTVQRRTERPAKFREAVRRHWGHTAVGVALGCAALAVARGSVLWLSPIVPSLVFSAPLAELIGRRDLGLFARRKGLLATPEETQPPTVVARADALARDYAEPPLAPRTATITFEPLTLPLAFTAGSAPAAADLPAAG